MEALANSLEAAEYLNAALEEGDRALFLSCLKNVVQAQGGVDKLSKMSTNDYIQDLIRHGQQRQQSLKLAIQEGINSGLSSRNAQDILKETKAQLKYG